MDNFRLTPEQAAERIASGVTLVDVRNVNNPDQPRIDGSTWMAKDDFLDYAKEHPGQQFVIYCNTSGGTLKTLERALANGQQNVQDIIGGVREWQARGLPTTQQS